METLLRNGTRGVLVSLGLAGCLAAGGQVGRWVMCSNWDSDCWPLGVRMPSLASDPVMSLNSADSVYF